MPSSEMIAHFVVEGEFLTDHARSWVLSNDPGRAWRMLRDSLCVDDEGQKLLAVSGILTGAKRFIGDSNVGLDLVDDDTAEGQRYARDLAFIYAGRFKRDTEKATHWRQVMEFVGRAAKKPLKKSKKAVRLHKNGAEKVA